MTIGETILSFALAVIILQWLFRLVKNNPVVIPEKRRSVADVKPGEWITIEWYDRIKGGVGRLKCLSNDPSKKVILLEVEWNNYKRTGSPQFEKLVLNYGDPHLANFHLLNTAQTSTKPKSLQEKLEEEMNGLLKQEKYEEASVIRDALKELKSKSQKQKQAQ